MAKILAAQTHFGYILIISLIVFPYIIIENLIYLAGGWGWRLIYTWRAHPGRAHPPPRLPVAGGWEILVA